MASTIPTPALPRVTIQFCTQCKWMLRAAYFAQELLSTFGTSLGEVALQPSTGGTFVVHLYHAATSIHTTGEHDGKVEVEEHLLWDRKAEGGFPETKELKRRVRDVIDPKRDLGHVDGKKNSTLKSDSSQTQDVPGLSATTDPSTSGAANTPSNSTNGASGNTAEKKENLSDLDTKSDKTPRISEHASGGSCAPGEKCEDCE